MYQADDPGSWNGEPGPFPKKKMESQKENGHLCGMKTKGKSKGMTEADSYQRGPNADSFSYACILLLTRIRIVHVTLSVCYIYIGKIMSGPKN